MPVPGTTSSTTARERAMNELVSRLKDPNWTAAAAAPAPAASPEIAALSKGMALGKDPLQGGILAVASLEGVAATKTAAPVTREPEEFAEESSTAAAPAGKTVAKDGNGAVKIEKEEISGMSLAERISQKSTLPPLYEGDQFAFIEIEQVPESEQIPQAGFVSSGSDFDLVTPTGGVDDSGNVMEVKLPENIAAIIEESARKINKGLAGSESRTR